MKSSRMPRALHLLMFGSGALALVYEILWMRRFASVFGAATPAVAATLAAFFLGFTAGSLVIGQRARRWPRPLRSYALLEIGAGFGALLVEVLLRFYDQIYPTLYRALAGSTAGFAAVKTILAMLALFVPTFCMGGTVPLLGHAFSSATRRLGISAGGLYAANTLGAAVGAFSVPFLWLPNLSARASYGVCVGGSLVIGLIAWWLDTRQEFFNPDKGVVPQTAAKPILRGHLSFRVLAILAGLSGAVLFVLQVVWSRMFAQIHENSIYSFSLVVAVLLVGLAAGAILARQLLRRGHEPKQMLGLSWMSAGAVVLLTPPLFFSLTNGLSYLEGTGGWRSYGLQILWLTLPTVFLPTVLAGMALPLLMEMGGATSNQPPGPVLGRLIGVNTAGAIAGSLLAAFLLPAWLGLWMSLTATAIVMILAGDYCLAATRPRRIWAPRRFILGALVAAVFLLWNPAHLPRTRIRADRGEQLLALQESSHGIVAVTQRAGSRRIKLNNFYVLGGTAATGDERVQAHLPLLLHPAPRRVAFLGLGTGITAGAGLLHPVESITAIEIVPEVIAAARDHFGDANLHVVDSPRVKMIAEDARNYLSGSPPQFDVIVGDLFVPWRRGEGSLYTADHFLTVRRALATNGIFCQWLPLFQLSQGEFDIVVATFLDVFPRTTLWRGDFAPNEPALALIGRINDEPIDPRVVERRMAEMKPDASNPTFVHPAGLWIYLAGSLDAKEPRFANAKRHRENQPWLELLGPLNHAGAQKGIAQVFVGRPLEAFLTELRARPLEGTPLARLEIDQRQWRDAGAKLGTSLLLLAEGNNREANNLIAQAAAELPPAIRDFLAGESARH